MTAHKFQDSNQDQVQDTGEPDLSGWEMKLYIGSGCAEPPFSTGMTNDEGNYEFSGLAPGDYSVKETPQNGWIRTTQPECRPMHLIAGAPQTVNFGNLPLPDLTITKLADQDPVPPGASLRYTIVVTNQGAAFANNVVFDDILPGRTRFEGWSPSDMDCSNEAGLVTCSVGNLPPQGTSTVYLYIRVLTASGVLRNRAIVDPDSAIVESDETNNTATITTTVTTSSPLKLPWPGGEIWYYTGGPHCDEKKPQQLCAEEEIRYAVDFAPEEQKRCETPNITRPDIKSDKWVVAAAPGTVVVRKKSVVEIQHQGGLRTGYAHLADIQVEQGGQVKAGQRLGHPSCAIEPGQTTEGVHLHFYNMQGHNKLPVHGQVLSGWTVHATELNYDGTMTKLTEDTRTADRGRCAPGRPDLPGCTVENIRNDLKSDNFEP